MKFSKLMSLPELHDHYKEYSEKTVPGANAQPQSFPRALPHHGWARRLNRFTSDTFIFRHNVKPFLTRVIVRIDRSSRSGS
jgi:hypothetical protein